MAAALIAHGVLDGVNGLLSSVLAGAVILAIMVLVILMRGMGMGDLKLMLAVGMFAGMQKCLWVMLFTVLINGVLSLAFALRKRYFKRAATNTLTILCHVVRHPFTPHPELNLDNESVHRYPFGVAVGLGCIVTVVYSGVIHP
jgi:prepilin peptidase CpaA